MMIGLNESACRQTMSELRVLVDRIAGTKLSSSFLAGFQWLHYQGKSKEPVQKLRDQETDIMNNLIIITA